MKELAKIGDVFEVTKDFEIDSGRVPAGIFIIFDGVKVCRGTVSTLLLACSKTTDENVYRKCLNGDLELPYETLNHLVQANALELFTTTSTINHIVDMQ